MLEMNPNAKLTATNIPLIELYRLISIYRNFHKNERLINNLPSKQLPDATMQSHTDT